MISGCMHGKDRIAKLALKFRLRSFVKLNASQTMGIIRPVSHERSVYILITKVRRLKGRFFVAAWHACTEDPAGSS